MAVIETYCDATTVGSVVRSKSIATQAHPPLPKDQGGGGHLARPLSQEFFFHAGFENGPLTCGDANGDALQRVSRTEYVVHQHFSGHA